MSFDRILNQWLDERHLYYLFIVIRQSFWKTEKFHAKAISTSFTTFYPFQLFFVFSPLFNLMYLQEILINSPNTLLQGPMNTGSTQEAVKTWRWRLLKNLETPFFSRYSKFLLISNWYWSKTSPKSFSKKKSNNYGC